NSGRIGDFLFGTALGGPLQAALWDVFPKIDAMAQPFEFASETLEVRGLAADRLGHERLLGAVKTRDKRRMDLVQGPGISHGSASWACRWWGSTHRDPSVNRERTPGSR